MRNATALPLLIVIALSGACSKTGTDAVSSHVDAPTASMASSTPPLADEKGPITLEIAEGKPVEVFGTNVRFGGYKCSYGPNPSSTTTILFEREGKSQEGSVTTPDERQDRWAAGPGLLYRITGNGDSTGTKAIFKRAQEDGDCADPCADEGLCAAFQGGCIAKVDDACARSHVCTARGECHVVDQRCGAPTDADCRASRGCQASGACGLVDGRCRPAQTNDCASAKACTDEGLCHVDGDHHCVADSETCRKSTACKQDGKCSLQHEDCAATSDGDCGGSVACKHDGKCAFESGEHTAPGCYVSEKGCKTSEVCRNEQRCKSAADGCVR